MYTREARYYDEILSFKDYAAEVRKLVKIIETHLGEGRLSLLDVACGTGKHLEHLCERYDCEGIDLSPTMLEVARERIPYVTLHELDMLTFDLGRAFDVVTCLFSGIGCVKTIDNLYIAIARMAAHVKPGGLLIVEPWFTPEQWQQNTVHMATVDRPDLKIARVNTSWAGSAGFTRWIIVIQKARQLRMQNTATNRVRRSVVRSLDSSARQPDLRILWKVSIFQRKAYHSMSPAEVGEVEVRIRVARSRSNAGRPRSQTRARPSQLPARTRSGLPRHGSNATQVMPSP